MGKLFRMNDTQFRRARRLIRRLCANYDGGNCLILNGSEPCPQLISPTLICKYFRAAVLPVDRELWAEVMRERPIKRCRICGVPITALSNATKYCPSCALRERRRKDAERKRKLPRTSAIRGPESPVAQGFQSVGPGRGEDLPPGDENGL